MQVRVLPSRYTDMVTQIYYAMECNVNKRKRIKCMKKIVNEKSKAHKTVSHKSSKVPPLIKVLMGE